MSSKCKSATAIFVIVSLFAAISYVAHYAIERRKEWRRKEKERAELEALMIIPPLPIDYCVVWRTDDHCLLDLSDFTNVYKCGALNGPQKITSPDLDVSDGGNQPFFQVSIPAPMSAVGDIYKYVWNYEEYFESTNDRKLCEAIATRKPGKIAKAIKSGCDPNAIGADGMPILFWSYFYGEEVVEALLKNGANPNVVLTSNYNIDSLFHIPGSSLLYTTIVFSTFQDPETNFFKDYPELLLKYGADPNFNDESPLTLALHWHGYDPNGGLIKLLLDKGADISRIDGRYRLGSPLLSAATRYDFGTVVELLKRGAETDPNEFVTRELQRSICAYKADYDAASAEERAAAKQYENYVKTVELLKERGISCEEPLAFESEFEKMHSRYWRLFGLGESVEELQ